MFLSYNAALYLVCALRARLGNVHSVGWEFEALAAYEHDQRDFVVDIGIQKQVIDLVNEVQVEGCERGQNDP